MRRRPQPYDLLRPHLLPYLSKSEDFEVLVPGCGSSLLGPKLYEDGVVNVSNIDVSPIVISWMRTAYAEYEEMDFSVMDATALDGEIEDSCFNLAIDKALLDALLCGDDGADKARRLLAQMQRVLKPGGALIVVSHAPPNGRLPLLLDVDPASLPDALADGRPLTATHVLASTADSGWESVEWKGIPKPALEDGDEEEAAVAAATLCHFMYVCRKRRD